VKKQMIARLPQWLRHRMQIRSVLRIPGMGGWQYENGYLVSAIAHAPSFDPKRLRCFATRFPRLRFLQVDINCAGPGDLGSLSALRDLASFSIGMPAFSRSVLHEVAMLGGLRTLGLRSESEIPADSLQQLRRLPRLTLVQLAFPNTRAILKAKVFPESVRVRAFDPQDEAEDESDERARLECYRRWIEATREAANS
jgi:hypothetical protein